MSFLKIITLIIATFLCCPVKADLMISPLRVVFNDNDRSHELALINSSDEEKVYRIEWSEQQALATGGYQTLGGALPQVMKPASTYIRFSPRQVKLKPGERQTIKLSARKPNNLAKGEYRSHLLLKALPKQSKDGEGIVLRAVVSYSLPIMLRNGEPSFNLSVNSASLALDKSGTNGAVTVELSKSGDYSSIGNMVAFWKAAGATKEVEIARLNDFSIYRELTTAKPTLHWLAAAPIAKSSGTLRIEYTGVKEYRTKNVLAERVFQISSGEIKPM